MLKFLGISANASVKDFMETELGVGHLYCFLAEINIQTIQPMFSSNSTHISQTVTEQCAGTGCQT